MPASQMLREIKAADVAPEDLTGLAMFVADLEDIDGPDAPLVVFLTHLIDSLRDGRDMVLMSTPSTDAGAVAEGLTVPASTPSASLHSRYFLVHRDLGDTWNVVACGLPLQPLTDRVPLPDETNRRCPTCWPAGVDPSTLRGKTKSEILDQNFRSTR